MYNDQNLGNTSTIKRSWRLIYMDYVKYYEIEKRVKMAAVIVTIIVASFVTNFLMYNEKTNVQAAMQQSLAQEVLRFHVLANSDSEEDQALKMKVKEAVLAHIDQEMPETKNVTETSEWMRRHVEELKQVGEAVIQKEGYDYTVSAAVTTCWFPEKTYGDLTFPQGNYKALRIEIGEAKGQNWWCVLYPGLCFVDAVNAVVPEEGKEKLRSVLSDDEYSFLDGEKDFKIGFYFLENILTYK